MRVGGSVGEGGRTSGDLAGFRDADVRWLTTEAGAIGTGVISGPYIARNLVQVLLSFYKPGLTRGVFVLRLDPLLDPLPLNGDLGRVRPLIDD